MKHVNANLRSICKGQVKDLERKIGPASSARSSSKGLKDNNNRLVSIVNKFCISICIESTISICGWLDSDCTVVTLRRVANFRVKHLKSDIERTGGYNKISNFINTTRILYSYTIFLSASLHCSNESPPRL